MNWISVFERIPEFEEPVWGLLLMQDSTKYTLAIVMRGDGEDGWLWHICDDWGGPRMISWPFRLEESAQFECDDLAARPPRLIAIAERTNFCWIIWSVK